MPSISIECKFDLEVALLYMIQRRAFQIGLTVMAIELTIDIGVDGQICRQ